MGFLKNLPQGGKRNRFAAPFGVQYPISVENGRSICLVALRNVQWDGAIVSVGAGCGIVSESHYEDELAELELKRNSVKKKTMARTYKPWVFNTFFQIPD